MVVRPQVFGDDRGFFFELYKQSDFEREGIKGHLVQDNYSRSAKGVLRGLHYQKAPRAQGKLVMCTQEAYSTLLLIYGNPPLPMENG